MPRNVDLTDISTPGLVKFFNPVHGILQPVTIWRTGGGSVVVPASAGFRRASRSSGNDGVSDDDR